MDAMFTIDPRVVDGAVQATERVHGELHHGLDRGGIGNVGLMSRGRAARVADCSDNTFGSRRIEVGCDNLGTPRGQHPRDRFADTGARTCDQHDFLGECARGSGHRDLLFIRCSRVVAGF
jgi:hypothetical protein